jgi:hypothetical protein
MEKQIKDFTDEEMLDEATRILTEGFTLHYDQQFTMGELVEYCGRIGSTDDDMLGYMQFNPKEYPDISIVSPKPEMLLGHCDLEWHSNGTVHHVVDGVWEHKEWLICLYCVGTCLDTVLSLSNNRDAFLDLPADEKAWWRKVEVQLNNNGGSIMGQYWNPSDKADAGKVARMEKYIQAPRHEGDERMPVVNVHPIGGQEFLYWQPPLISKAWHDGKEIEIAPLQEKFDAVINRTKYIKDIVFRPGDILIMDQFYTLHRRSPILDKNRELWRVAIDYKNTIDK